MRGTLLDGDALADADAGADACEDADADEELVGVTERDAAVGAAVGVPLRVVVRDGVAMGVVEVDRAAAVDGLVDVVS